MGFLTRRSIGQSVNRRRGEETVEPEPKGKTPNVKEQLNALNQEIKTVNTALEEYRKIYNSTSSPNTFKLIHSCQDKIEALQRQKSELERN